MRLFAKLGGGLLITAAMLAAFTSKPPQKGPSPDKTTRASAAATTDVASRSTTPRVVAPIVAAEQPIVPAVVVAPPATPPSIAGASVATAELIGQVVGVADGDTLTVLDAAKVQHKLRLEGIDAPESHQAYGTRSKQELSKRVYLKPVRVEVTGTDKYGRELGHVYVGDRWINREMVEGGYAWHYKKYSSDGDLARAEDYARQSKAGLWSMPNPIAPWDFRHDPAKAATAMAVNESTPATPRYSVALDTSADGGATVYVTNTGSKYHSVGCRHLSKSAIPISLEEAARRYSACSVCGS